MQKHREREEIMSKQKKYSLGEQFMVGLMIALCGVQPALAGTKGSYMNSAGYGKSVNAITYNGQSATASSPNMNFPCSRVNPDEAPTFSCNNVVGLPAGFPEKAYCQSRGEALYRWFIQAYVAGGATADNPELEGRLGAALVPQSCAEIDVETVSEFTDGFSGTITLNGFATAGAAVWVRGYEFAGVPPGADEEEFLETLKTEGVPRFDIMLVGPFALGECGLPIPFTTETGHQNLYLVTDTVAQSYEFSVSCPTDVVTFGCGEPVEYPAVEVVGGCGEVDVTFDPPPDQLPFGQTTVTVTATDDRGSTVECTFTAVRQGITFDGFYPPISGTGGTCDDPLRAINRGSNVPVKFVAVCEGAPLTSGHPTFLIEQCSGGSFQGGGVFTLVGNEWHFNWNTDGLKRGVYKLTAILQDESERFVYVRIK
jgi:hypothetical protein